MDTSEPLTNESRCPYEKIWHCALLDIPCHPGIKGCVLSGQSLVDALIAYREHQSKDL